MQGQGIGGAVFNQAMSEECEMQAQRREPSFSERISLQIAHMEQRLAMLRRFRDLVETTQGGDEIAALARQLHV